MTDEQPARPSALYEHRDVDWTQYYAAIGEFVVAFEKIPTALRFNYNCIAQIKGLSVWELSANLLNIPSLGPEVLAIAYCSAVNAVSPDDDLRARASDIIIQTKNLANRRNEIVHGEWMIGPDVAIISDIDHLPENNGIKRKVTKTGEKISEQPTIAEFAELIANCRAVAKEIKDIFTVIVMAHYDAEDAKAKS